MPVPYPYYIAKGTWAAGAAAIVVPAPTCVANDLLFLVVATANEAITVTTAGWTQIPTVSPQYTGTAKQTASARIGVYYRWANSATPGPVAVADSGDFTTAIQFSVRGVANDATFINTSAGRSLGASTNVNCLGLVTTKPYTKVIHFIGLDKDATDSDTITAWFPPSTARNGLEIHDQTINTVNGGGLAIYTFDMLNAGATGNVFGTGDSSTVRSYISIALNTKYQRRIPKLR
jgi:hypothetical protein